MRIRGGCGCGGAVSIQRSLALRSYLRYDEKKEIDGGEKKKSHPAQICASLARDNRQNGACVPYHAYAQHVMCEKKQRTTPTRAWRHLPSKMYRKARWSVNYDANARPS